MLVRLLKSKRFVTDRGYGIRDGLGEDVNVGGEEGVVVRDMKGGYVIRMVGLGFGA